MAGQRERRACPATPGRYWDALNEGRLVIQQCRAWESSQPALARSPLALAPREARRHGGRRMATDLASDQPPTRCLLGTLSQAHVWAPGDSDTLLAKDRGISGGRIVSIGRISDSARRIINADGLIVAPGFIDGHRVARPSHRQHAAPQRLPERVERVMAVVRPQLSRSRRTLNVGTGRENPFSVRSPTGSASTSSSTSPSSRREIRIWPGAASPQSRAARLVTVPIAP